MAAYRVMFVDDEDYIRSMLTAYFKDKFAMTTADGAEEALSILAREHYDLVVSDVNMPNMDGPDFLAEVERRYPNVKRALLTSSNIDDYVKFARDNAISSIIPKTVPFNFSEVEDIVTGLLTGEIFGLLRHLRREDGIAADRFCIKSLAEANAVRDQVVAKITEMFQEAGDTRLILEEILMNAIYHIPADAGGGTLKYAAFADVTLEPSEYVHVELGYDSEKYAVSVLDNRGALTRETVLSKMERQITGEGFMDDSGRGLHMARLFADRLIINVERGKRTEVIIMNFLGGKYRGFKPIFINEI